MNKYFITFGSNQLPRFIGSPMNVMLIIQGEDFWTARENLMKDEELDIGNRFAFQYELDEADDMTSKFGMRLYTREELLSHYIEKD